MEGEQVNGVHGKGNKGDGDRVFEAASKLVDELRRGELGAKLKSMKDARLEDLDLPPIVEQTLLLASRKLKGKLADLKEFAGELRELAKHKSGNLSDKLAENFDLPTKEDIGRLERRVRELERENEALRAKSDIPKRKATVARKSTKTKSKSRSRA